MSDPAVTEPDVPVAVAAPPRPADQSDERLPWLRLARWAALALGVFTLAGGAAVMVLRDELGGIFDDPGIGSRDVHALQLGLVEPRLIELETRAEELATTRRAQLEAWSWVDREKSLVRMPVGRAMQLVVEGRR